MSPSDADVLATFRARVNMSADELAAWLDDPESAHAGTGAGLDSGRRILAILRKNPKGDPKGYDEEDVKHMRKVVAYLARHLAQEGHLKDTKTTDELAHTKSTISLRNWGHDPVKAKMQGEGGTAGTKEDDDGESTTADEPSPSGADEKGENVDADADAAKPATRSQDKSKSARGDKAGVSAGSKRKRGHADGVARDRGSGGEDGGGNDDDEDVEAADADADYDVDDGKVDEEDSSGEDAEDGPRPAVQRKTEAGAESIDEEPEA